MSVFGNWTAGMRPLLAIAGLFLAAFGAAPSDAGEADGCGLIEEETGRPARIEELPDGVFLGGLKCRHGIRAVSVWTMTVDGGAARLGIRDDPLFDGVGANPLVAVASIGYDDSARFTVFRRNQSVTGGLRAGAPDRIFGTLCTEIGAGAEVPLDCSFGEHRVKMRVDIRDNDVDGVHDRAYHEISIYDGDSRLQVIYMETTYDRRPQSLVRHWLTLLGEIGIIALPG